jgi:putative Mn2+ efflux pump MntP
MTLMAIVVLAFSMSADGFAAALTKGALLEKPRLGKHFAAASSSPLSRRSRL